MVRTWESCLEETVPSANFTQSWLTFATLFAYRWRISYWFGFLAQFTWLPLHQEFVDSGKYRACL